MNYYTKINKKRKIRKFKVLFVCFLLLVTFSFSYVYLIVNPVVVEASRQAVYSLSTSAVSDAIYDVLTEENLSYEDLVNFEKDADGNIIMINLRTIKLNLIARRFYQVAQVYLDSMGEIGVQVPLGAFTGMPFLAGIGPKVNLKLVSIGAMTSTFKSNFTSAGINQTNHSVYVTLFASVSLILPAYSATIDSVTEMLVAESVIVGKVPQIYFGSNNGLNFSPTLT